MIANKLFDEIKIGDSAFLKRTLTKADSDMFAIVNRGYEPYTS